MPFIIPANRLSTSAVHNIDQSIRFDSTTNAHMDRTPSSAGNQKTWTFSCWVKRGKLGSRQYLFTAFDGNNTNVGMGIFRFQADDTLNWAGYSTNLRRTTQVFRDTSAWYHIVLSVDTTNAVGSERQRIYINGERVTDFADSSDMAFDTAYSINGNHAHAIGIGLGNQSSYDFDGYMAEIVLLDGTATDCNSFAEFNSSGIWIPKDVSGLTFGTNGFHITGATANDLGADVAGSNNYTTSDLNEHDQMLDSPTNNFCTLNPRDVGNSPTITEGNLSQTKGSASYASSRGTFGFDATDTEGIYFEVCSVDATGSYIGILPPEPSDHGASNATSSADAYIIGTRGSGGGNTWWTDDGGNINAGNDTSVSKSAGQIIGVAVKNGKVYFSINGVYVLSANPATEANPNFSSLTGIYQPYLNAYNTEDVVLNAGQDDTFANNKTSGSAAASDSKGNGKFYYAPPSGFKALCSKSMGAE